MPANGKPCVHAVLRALRCERTDATPRFCFKYVRRLAGARRPAELFVRVQVIELLGLFGAVEGAFENDSMLKHAHPGLMAAQPWRARNRSELIQLCCTAGEPRRNVRS